MGWRAQEMDPDTCDGTPLVGSRCRARSWIYSRIGWRKRSSVRKSLFKNEATDGHVTGSTLRSRFRPLLIVTALAAIGAASGLSAENSNAPTAPASQSERGAVASPPPAAGNSPRIVEWLNETVHLRDTVQALDRPSPDGRAAGRIRGGAEVKAIGIVAGREWVQIELPDQVLAYIPVGAVKLNESTATSSPGQKAEPAAAPMPGATSPEPASTAAIVQGPVTRVPNAATLVVGDQRIRLSGVDPGPPTVLAPFENWLRAQGALSCEPDAQTGRYRCFTSGGVDVAEAAILERGRARGRRRDTRVSRTGIRGAAGAPRALARSITTAGRRQWVSGFGWDVSVLYYWQQRLACTIKNVNVPPDQLMS